MVLEATDRRVVELQCGYRTSTQLGMPRAAPFWTGPCRYDPLALSSPSLPTRHSTALPPLVRTTQLS